MSEICPCCDEKFENVAAHWSYVGYPDLTPKQYNVAVGLLMGDGCIDYSENRESRLICGNTTEKYLKYLDNIFDIFSNGYVLSKTPEEAAQMEKVTGNDWSDSPKDYSAVYRFQTKTHPKFTEMREWYSSGEKVFPKNITLTSTVLKNWYCSDGTLFRGKGVGIAMCNERENKSKIDDIFKSSGLPSPDWWNESERKDAEGYICVARWDYESSENLFEFMGKPTPGFEHKWPVGRRDI